MNQLVIANDASLQQGPDTIEALLVRFIGYLDVKPVTVKSYSVCIRCFMEWLHDNEIQHPQRADVLAYKEWLNQPHPRRKRCDRPDGKEGNVIVFSAGTQARYLRAVKMFFRWTQNEGLYPNVADNIKGAKCRADNQKRDALQKDDAKTLLESIERQTEAGKRDYAMILLSITAGLRIIELQRANVGNMEMIAGDHVLFIQGKGHDEPDAYKKLTPEVYDAIMDYLSTRKHREADAPLFASSGNRSRGRRLTEPSISRIIKQRLIDAGYNTHRLSAHSLRHTSVTFLLKSGANLQEAQYHARHASPETTGIYSHNIKEEELHSEQQIYDYLFDVKQDASAQAMIRMKSLSAEKQKMVLDFLNALTA